MAMNWVVKQKSVDQVKKDIDSFISKTTVPQFVSVGWDGNDLCVRVEKGGKSEFRIAVKPAGQDVQIVETKRDISFLHKPFVGKVEGVVAQIMSDAGAAKA